MNNILRSSKFKPTKIWQLGGPNVQLNKILILKTVEYCDLIDKMLFEIIYVSRNFEN